MNHLTTPEKVKKVRSVAATLNDDKVLGFIIEAEQLYVKNRLGDALFIDLLDYVNATDKTGFPAEYSTLLAGGIYTGNSCGNTGKRQFMGLEAALNYYTYAKLVEHNDFNVTRFGGAMMKKDDYSNHSELKEKLAEKNSALVQGDIYIEECLEFLKANKENIPLFTRAGNAENRLEFEVLKFN